MESLKDESAIVKIDTPALIKELTASSVESELDLRGVEVGEEQEKEEDVAEEVGSFRPRGISDLRPELQIRSSPRCRSRRWLYQT